MIKRIASAAVLVLIASSLTVALAGETSKGGEVAYTGWITDEWCGANNANAKGKDCALACWKKGAKLVLWVPQTKSAIALNDQEKASEHIGVEVKVEGVMKGETLEVSAISPVKKS